MTVLRHQTKLQGTDYLKSYVENGPLKGERLDSRYALCLRAFLDFNLIWATRRNASPIPLNFILELGHRNKGDALRVFSDMKSDKRVAHRHLLGTISFGEKKDFPALQAADMLAYLFYCTEYEKLAKLPLLQEDYGPFYDPDGNFE